MNVARWSLLAAAAATGALLASPPARANGRLPGANQIAVSPSDPKTLITRSTFGLLLTHDQGKSWDWICETALGFTDTQDPSIGLLANGAVLAGTYGGLVVSPDTGCNWSFAAGALAGIPIIDIVVRKGAPGTAYALASKHTSDTDAGDPLYDTRVFATTDSGATWSAIGAPIDPAALVETIEISASDPGRFYVSGVKGSGTQSTGTFYASTDTAATWTERAVPFDPVNERAPYIAAVDPSNANRVYVRTSGPSSSRLFVTDDAGKTFGQKWSGGVMLGFALAPDGAKVYVGGRADGVNVASTADFTFTKTSATPVECLTATAGTLYACSSDKTAGFTVGASTDDGATFAPLLRLNGIRGPIACQGDAAAVECAQEWPALRDILGAGADAGSDASAQGADSGAPPGDAGSASSGASSSSSCGCREASPATGSLSVVAIVVAALLGMRSRYKK